MRNVAMGTVVVMGLLVSTTGYAKGPTREFDRFKNQTNYEADVELSKLSETTPSVSLKLDAITTGNKPITKTDKITLTAMVTYNMRWSTRCAGAGVDALIDGNPLVLDKVMSPVFYSGYAITGTSKDFTFAQAQSFISSQTMEFRICGTEYTLSPEQMATFKDFWDLAQQPVTQETP